MEPEPLAAANRAAAREEPQRGKKESAAESKRLIGGRLSGSGSLGLWPDARKEAALGDSASILAAFAAPTASAKKGESRAVREGSEESPRHLISGEKDSHKPSRSTLFPSPRPAPLPEGKLRHRARQQLGYIIQLVSAVVRTPTQLFRAPSLLCRDLSHAVVGFRTPLPALYGIFPGVPRLGLSGSSGALLL